MDKRNRKIYIIFLLAVVLWCAGLFLGPVASHLGHDPIAELDYLFYSKVCHQRPERSFFFLGNQLAVCQRCAAIYIAFLAGTIAYPFIMKKDRMLDRMWLIIAIIPLAIDGFGQLIGFWESDPLKRVLTGSIVGAVGPFYVIPGTIGTVWTIKKNIKEKYYKKRNEEKTNAKRNA
jgi:uncharacterized membrane protein